MGAPVIVDNDPNLLDWLTAAGVLATFLGLGLVYNELVRLRLWLAHLAKGQRQVAINVASLETAVDSIQDEVTEVVNILTGDGDAQARIDAAVAKLSGNESALRQALDAANPTTPGGVNDGE